MKRGKRSGADSESEPDFFYGRGSEVQTASLPRRVGFTQVM